MTEAMPPNGPGGAFMQSSHAAFAFVKEVSPVLQTANIEALRWRLPKQSDRRMLARVLSQVAKNPLSGPGRLNRENVSNFLHYRSRRFCCLNCNEEGYLLYDCPNLRLRREHGIGILREMLQCRNCFASMRQRALSIALLEFVQAKTNRSYRSIAELAGGGLGAVHVLDTDGFSAISRFLARDESYIFCSCRPDLEWVEEIGRQYYNININSENIDFDDTSFGVVLTSDVMEHVRDSGAAHNEISRVPRVSGAYIFTVPIDEAMEHKHLLVDTSGEADVFLRDPHYHGDPITGQILAYRIFGRELLSELEDLRFRVAFQLIDSEEHLVIAGDVFTALKQESSI